MVPECSLFDENAAIQDHLFVGGHAQPSEWEQYHDNNDDHDNDAHTINCSIEKLPTKYQVFQSCI